MKRTGGLEEICRQVGADRRRNQAGAAQIKSTVVIMCRCGTGLRGHDLPRFGGVHNGTRGEERGQTNRLRKHKTLASAVVREEREREVGAWSCIHTYMMCAV